VFETIAWASDGSDLAGAELGWVSRFAAGEQAMLWTVHVALPPTGEATEARSETEEASIARLKGHVRGLRDHGLNASLYVVRGARPPVGAAIGAAAHAVQADLLVLRASRRSGDVAPGPGGVVPDVLAAAPCPVLMLPPLVSSTPARAAAHL
jgi:nucleotide-binding universal stress UspA family protein